MCARARAACAQQPQVSFFAEARSSVPSAFRHAYMQVHASRVSGLQQVVQQLGEELRKAHGQLAGYAANTELHRKTSEAMAKYVCMRGMKRHFRRLTCWSKQRSLLSLLVLACYHCKGLRAKGRCPLV